MVSNAVSAAPKGQTSALVMSTVAFTVCFAVWTIFSIIGIQIKKDLGLSETDLSGENFYTWENRFKGPF